MNSISGEGEWDLALTRDLACRKTATYTVHRGAERKGRKKKDAVMFRRDNPRLFTRQVSNSTSDRQPGMLVTLNVARCLATIHFSHSGTAPPSSLPVFTTPLVRSGYKHHICPSGKQTYEQLSVHIPTISLR